MIRCETRQEYEELLEERKVGWPRNLTEYWEKHIERHVDKSALWSARKIGFKRIDGLSGDELPSCIFDSQQAESINKVVARRCEGSKSVDLADMVHILRDYQRSFLSEVARGFMRNPRGLFKLKDKYKKDNDEEKAEILLGQVIGSQHMSCKHEFSEFCGLLVLSSATS